jgi:filamentous hemagglutinin family protein
MITPELRLEVPLVVTSARSPAPRTGIKRQLRASTALRQMLRATAWSGVSIAIVSAASANPTGGTVVSGQANINQTDPNRTVITQSTDRAAINWQSFNIGAKQSVVIAQPSSSSWELERVIGSDPSRIAGRLSSNGNVALINPNGLFFSQGSQIDVNGLVATTANIRDRDFNEGRFNFSIPSSNPNAKVVNKGTITVADHGLAALVAPQVRNSGTITAKFGRVMLAGAQTFTVDLYGDGLLSFDVTSKVKGADVTNLGKIEADGGVIQLSASSVDDIVTGVINMGGTVAANTVGTQTGTISADAGANGQLNVTGQVSAQGANAGETGGSIALTGGNVDVMSTATIDASGSAGGGSIKVGGGFHGTDTNIANAQTTTIAAGATLDASAVQQGDGGSVVVWSDKQTNFAGTIRAKGGAKGGNGGKAEVSSKGKLAFTGKADLTAPKGKAGTLLLDPTELDIIAPGTDTADACTTAGVCTVPDDSVSNLTTTTLTDLLGSAGTVSLAADTIDFQASVNYTGATPASLTATATNSITLEHDVSINSGTAKLAVSFDAGVSGGVTLGANSSIGTNGGALSIAAGTGGLTLDHTASLATTGGAALGDGNLSLSAPSLSLIGAINAGAGTLSLTATDATTPGAITESAATVTAGSLTGSTAGGAVTLTDGTSTNAISALSAFTTGDGDFSLASTTPLNVTAAVNAGSGALSLNVAGALGVGADLTGSSVALTATGASGSISQTAGTITGTTSVALSAGGAINQTGGTIKTPTLTGSSNGGATLSKLNQIANLGPFANTTSGGFSLVDAQPLNVSGVVTSGGDLALTASSLSIPGTLNAGANTVTLTANAAAPNGTISETGSIIAGTLTGSSTGDTALTGSNTIATLSGFNSGNGNFALTDTGDLAVTDDVLAGTGGININTTGLLTLGGATTALNLTGSAGTTLAGTGVRLAQNVTTNGATSINAGIDAYTDGGKTLSTTDSALSLAATTLVLTATTTSLDSGTAATTITAATGEGLSVGAGTTGSTLGISDGQLALIRAGGGLTLATTGTNDITVDGAVTDHAAGFTSLALNAGRDVNINGNIAYTGATAESLAATAGRSIALNADITSTQAPLQVALSGGTDVTLHSNAQIATDGGSLSISASTGVIGLNQNNTLDTTGTPDGDLSLSAPKLTLRGTIDAGAATLTLTATDPSAAGTIAEDNAQVTAGVLMGSSGGTTKLRDTPSNNAIGDIRDFKVANNDFNFTDVTALTLDGTFTVPGTMTLNAPSITQKPGSTITAGTLTGETSTGTASFTQTGNAVTALGDFAVSTGNFTLTDGIALTVTGDVATSNGNIALTAPGPELKITGTLDSGTGTTTLAAPTGTALVAGAPDATPGVPANSLLIADGSLDQITAGGGVVLATDGADIFANGVTGHGGFGRLTLNGRNIAIDGGLAVGTTGTLSLIAAGTITENAGGTVGAGMLTGSAGSDVSLAQTGNTVGKLDAFTVGGTGNFSLNDGTRDLGISGRVTVPGILTLNAGSITELTNGAITAGTLTGGTATGDVTLANANAVKDLGAFAVAATHDFTLNNGTTALTIDGSVTVPGTLTLNAGSITETGVGTITAGKLTGTSGSDVLLANSNVLSDLGAFAVTAGNFNLNDGPTVLSIDGTVKVPGTLTLTAGSITENAGGQINAGTLTGRTSTGDAILNQTNQIASLDAFTSANNLSLTDGKNLNVTGPVAAGPSGNVTLDVTGDLGIANNVGASTIVLKASGAINQTGGTISGAGVQLTAGTTIDQTGGLLSAGALSGSSGADVTLAQTGNAINDVGGFTTGGGKFTLNDSLALTVINAPISTTGGDISLTVPGLTLTLPTSLDSGSGKTTITALGDPMSVGDGFLFGPLPGSLVLGNATLDAINAGGGLTLSTQSGQNMLAGVVTPHAGFSKLTLNSAGNIDIDVLGNVNVTSLQLSAAGTVTEDSFLGVVGSITATTLTGTSSGGTSLTGSNKIAQLGPFSNTGPGNIALTDAQTLNITGPVNAGTGDLTFNVTGGLGIAAGVSAGGTVSLGVSGVIAETGAGAVSANTLTGSSNGGATLNGANQIANLGPFSNSGLGDFSLTDGKSLTVSGPVSAGIAGNSLTLNTTGDLVIAQNLTATNVLTLTASGAISQTGGTISSHSAVLNAGGTISQTGGVINVLRLSGNSTGGAKLGQANSISVLDTFTNADGGGFTLNDTLPLNVNGAVNAGTGDLAITALDLLISSTLTAGGNVTLNTSGQITQSGGTISGTAVSLVAGGAINESGGAIDAATLSGSSNGGAGLVQAANQIADLTGFTNTGAGGFTLRDGRALTVSGAVNAGTDSLSLGATGPLSLAADLTAGSTVTLTSTTGAVTQTAGIISANALNGSSVGGTTLNEANQIANLTGFTNTGAGGFSLTDTQSLTVAAAAVNAGSGDLTLNVTGALSLGANISGGGAVTLTATGPSGAINQTGGLLTGGTITLDTPGAIAQSGNAILSGTDVTLNAGGAITQSGTATITAVTLTGAAGGDTILFQDNNVATLGSFSAAGNFFLADLSTLNVTGPVTAGNGANNILEIIDAHGINLAGNLSAGFGVALGAEGGPLMQTAGAITTNTLEAISAGGATLTQPGNRFANLDFFENFGGGNVIVKDGAPLMVSGTLVNAAGGIAIQTTGEMTLGGASISAPGGLELGSTGFRQTGNVSISGQTPLVVIDATGAALPQTVNISSAASLLSSFEPGGTSGNISLATLSAPNAAVLLSANSGNITGTIDAESLAVLGTGGSAQLFGNVRGIAGSTAAQAVGKSGRRENNYRFNNCAIGSITCTVLPSIVPAKPAPVTNFGILTQQQFTDPTINLLNVGTEDLY